MDICSTDTKCNTKPSLIYFKPSLIYFNILPPLLLLHLLNDSVQEGMTEMLPQWDGGKKCAIFLNLYLFLKNDNLLRVLSIRKKIRNICPLLTEAGQSLLLPVPPSPHSYCSDVWSCTRLSECPSFSLNHI